MFGTQSSTIFTIKNLNSTWPDHKRYRRLQLLKPERVKHEKKTYSTVVDFRSVQLAQKQAHQWRNNGLLDWQKHEVNTYISQKDFWAHCSSALNPQIKPANSIQAFRIIDKKAFCCILLYQRPTTKESDIPHHTKLHDEIIEKANLAIERLKDHFKVSFFCFSAYIACWYGLDCS